MLPILMADDTEVVPPGVLPILIPIVILIVLVLATMARCSPGDYVGKKR